MSQPLFEQLEAASRYINGLPQGAGEWLMGQRQAAAQQFADLGFPHAKQEAWKYTSVDGLLERGFRIDEQERQFSQGELTSHLLP